MNDLLRFIASPAGRWIRMGTGASLILGGLLFRRWWLAILGLAPLGAGALDLCLMAPLAGKPLKGEDLRRSLEEPEESGGEEAAQLGQ
ncbi:MAG: DUF2892 domain-containing protein [Candidatus Zixiibacteriota bacterium]|nr:MAG: DUF2892 domain-containing protein [candidate division Zixibacteria bacterium]